MNTNDITEEQTRLSIHAWIQKHNIKTEVGVPLDFYDHRYMWDIYADFSMDKVIMKAAQVTMSTCASIQAPWIAKHRHMDVIYTLPTESDRNAFVGGKVNRIISQNPIMQEYTKDKDSIEQKRIGENIIHYRGTFTQKAAMMVPSDLNIYDEVDTSKADVIEQYSTRLQHSKYKGEWYFSHPSAEGYGVHKYWLLSDQKHWFVTCGACGYNQYLAWPESIDIEKKKYVCKKCHKEITDDMRREGRWVARYKNRKYSGYWIPLLICPWVSAADIIDYKNKKSEEYFYNKVLGLPFTGGGNKLTWNLFAQNLTTNDLYPDVEDPMVLGVDTGLRIDYVLGGQKGLIYHGDTNEYATLDALMKQWPNLVAVVDAGGDFIGSRAFQERWRGRVFLCYFGVDRKTQELFRWGENDEFGSVIADRNRTIQLVVDEFRTKRIPVQGDEESWESYWEDWNNLTRVKVLDPVTGEHKGHKWIRSGRDHRALATVYWRIGMDRYGQGHAEILNRQQPLYARVSPEVRTDDTIQHLTTTGADPVAETLRQLRENQGEDDWRNAG